MIKLYASQPISSLIFSYCNLGICIAYVIILKDTVVAKISVYLLMSLQMLFYLGLHQSICSKENCLSYSAVCFIHHLHLKQVHIFTVIYYRNCEPKIRSKLRKQTRRTRHSVKTTLALFHNSNLNSFSTKPDTTELLRKKNA